MTKTSSNERAALAAMQAAAADGTLFSRPTTDPARACWHALLACGDPRLRQMAKDAETLAVQVADRKKYAAMSRSVCPQCGRKVGPEHFACCSGAKGGRVGGKATGAAKVRGDSAHYRAMVAARKDRKANNDLRGVCQPIYRRLRMTSTEAGERQ